MTGELLERGVVRSANGVTVFWMPALDGEDQPYQPEIFTPQAICSLRLGGDDVWLRQYMLYGPDEIAAGFDEEVIREAFFRYLDPGRTVLAYQGFEFDPDELDDDGFARFEQVEAKVGIDDLRFYVHVDPKHRAESQRRAPGKGRPTEAAIAVVGVAPDHHAFLVDYWTADASLEETARMMLLKYLYWAPHLVTYEAIGAQFWVKEYIVSLERTEPHCRRPRARTRWGAQFELPRLSTRLVEAETRNRSKEAIYREVLGGWIHRGVLHLDRDHHETPLHQLVNTNNEKMAVDLVDAIAQGPEVWQAPPRPGILRRANRRLAYVEAFLGRRKDDQRLAYSTTSEPWKRRRRTVR